MKICTKCNEEKAIEEFSLYSKAKDKQQRWCKGCMAAYDKSPAGRAASRGYDRSEKGKETRHRRNRTQRGKTTQRKRGRNYRAKYPERLKANNALCGAVRDGILVRPATCQVNSRCCCGCVEGHHDDYSRPLDVEWLCHYHHNKIPPNAIPRGLADEPEEVQP